MLSGISSGDELLSPPSQLPGSSVALEMTTNMDRFKKEYGSEYPRAVTLHGVRMALERETEFSRLYSTEDGKHRFMISRFMDGSASISLAELEAGWPGWSDSQRLDFCNACGWLEGLGDLPNILRFVMEQSELTYVRAVALSVAHRLPRVEAFDLLRIALRKADGHDTANITQAIARTKHPEAQETLLAHLDELWRQDDLWHDDPFTNWRALDATCCIAHLLDLGASPGPFEEKVRLLAAHPCQGNRDSCSLHLRQHYGWLPPRAKIEFGR